MAEEERDRELSEHESQLIESFRLKYKQQAKAAVDEAYERGKREAHTALINKLKSAEEETRQWKTIAEALSNKENANALASGGKKMDLVRLIMEQVYRDAKKECSGDAEFTDKLKKILLTSTSQLTKQLPKLVLLLENDNVVMEKKSITQPTCFPLDRPHCLKIWMPRRPCNIIPIITLSAEEQPSKGIFNKSHTNYNIDVVVQRIQQPDEVAEQFRVARRFSDFTLLYQQLIKGNPCRIIPQLPSRESLQERKGDVIAAYRKRNLKLWLQYICLHPELQRMPVVHHFCTSHDMTSSWFPDSLSSSSDNLLYEGSLNASKGSKDNDRVSKPVKYSQEAKYKCIRSFHTVSRDFSQLKPNIKNAVESTVSLIKSLDVMSKSISALSSAMKAVADFEDVDLDKSCFNEVISGLSQTQQDIVGVDAVFNVHILEPLLLVGVEGMKSANAVMDIVHKSDNTISLEMHEDLVNEWSIFRTIRHAEIANESCQAVQMIADKHNRFNQLWQHARSQIQMLDPKYTNSIGVGRGWKSSVKHEIDSYAELVANLDKSHKQKVQLQNVFCSTAAMLARDRDVPPKYNDSTSSDLYHQATDRPVIPKGVRREPSRTNIVDELAADDQAEDISKPVNPTANSKVTVEPSEKTTQKSWTSYLWNKSSKAEVNTTRSSLHDRDSIGNERISTNEWESDEEDTLLNRAYRDQLAKQHNDGVVDDQMLQDDDGVAGPDKKNTKRRPKQGGGAMHRKQKPKGPETANNTIPDDSYTGGDAVGHKDEISSSYFGSNQQPTTSASHHQSKLKEEHTYSQQRPSQPPATPPSSQTHSKLNDVYSNSQRSSEQATTQKQSRFEDHDNIYKGSSETLTRKSQNQNTVDEESEVLPEGWEAVITDKGEKYYYHKVTRVSRWDKPTVEVANAVEQRILESKRQVDEAVERRKQEREQNRAVEEEVEKYAEELKGKIQKCMNEWRYGVGGKTKHIAELLSSVTALLGPTIFPDGNNGANQLTIASPPPEVKKAYMKTIRLVHPDKLSGCIDLEKKLLAQEVFIALSQLYDVYRKAHNL